MHWDWPKECLLSDHSIVPSIPYRHYPWTPVALINLRLRRWAVCKCKSPFTKHLRNLSSFLLFIASSLLWVVTLLFVSHGWAC
jgi:hypothetical protein